MTRYTIKGPSGYYRYLGSRTYDWCELGQGETSWEFMSEAIWHAESRGLESYEVVPVR